MKTYLLIFALLLGAVSSWGQNLNTDYIVIDKTAPNLAQLQTQYSGQNVFFNDNAKPAPYVIGIILNGKHAVDLHLFVATEPGSLNFNSGKITAGNASGFTRFFQDWKTNISGKVIIHSSDVFTTPDGKSLKTKLEEITGLNFTTP